MTSLIHANKRLWQRHVIAENRRSIEGLLATLNAEPLYVIMATGAEHRGREAVAAFYTGLFVSMPDVIFDLQAAYIGENGVVEESVLVGTHTGDLMGIPATGKPVHVTGMDILRLENGKIKERWAEISALALMMQLGVIPSPPPPSET